MPAVMASHHQCNLIKTLLEKKGHDLKAVTQKLLKKEIEHRHELTSYQAHIVIDWLLIQKNKND